MAAPLNRHFFADPHVQALKLAADVAARLREALARRGSASLIVPGGRTPVEFFAALSSAALDWERITVGLTDERVTDPGADGSNEFLVRRHLLAGNAAAAQFRPWRSHGLEAIARPYDMVVLGMGDDGHCASLFPGAAGLEAALDPAAPPALVAITPPAARLERVSLNLAALLEARHIAVLIQGAAKLSVLEHAAQGASPLELPVAAILGQARVPVDVYWAN